jgi:hypothetical protein
MPATTLFSVTDLLTPTGDDTWPEIPQIVDNRDLVALHQQLLDAADTDRDPEHDASRSRQLLCAARMVKAVADALLTVRDDEALSIAPTVITRVIEALRLPADLDILNLRRFEHAQGRLDHLHLVNEYRRPVSHDAMGGLLPADLELSPQTGDNQS